MLKVGRRKYMNLTEAMAHSNNVFFEQLGSRMDSKRFPSTPTTRPGRTRRVQLPDDIRARSDRAAAYGGVARMSSFGEGIQATRCNLRRSPRHSQTAELFIIAVPHSQEEVENFTPRVKRELNIGTILPEIREGMLAAFCTEPANQASTGAARRCRSGRRGLATTTRRRRKSAGSSVTRTTRTEIALAVLLRGNTRTVKGPTARCRRPIYRKLREQNFCGLRARRSPQDRQLTQIGISKYRFSRAAEDLCSVSFVRRACSAASGGSPVPTDGGEGSESARASP